MLWTGRKRNFIFIFYEITVCCPYRLLPKLIAQMNNIAFFWIAGIYGTGTFLTMKPRPILCKKRVKEALPMRSTTGKFDELSITSGRKLDAFIYVNNCPFLDRITSGSRSCKKSGETIVFWRIDHAASDKMLLAVLESESAGSACFWAPWIRIYLLVRGADPVLDHTLFSLMSWADWYIAWQNRILTQNFNKKLNF